MEVEYESSDGDYDNRDVDSWLYSSVVEGWESSQFRMKPCNYRFNPLKKNIIFGSETVLAQL